MLRNYRVKSGMISAHDIANEHDVVKYLIIENYYVS